MPAKLSPTSYAVLGLLSSGPLSAYELTKHMRRSALAELWPRTEASLYKEPKLLEAHGFVTATAEATGARTRTVYALTAAGRRALGAWLRTPGQGLVFECEAALKAFFGDAGTLEDLQSQLGTLARAIATTEPSPAETLRHLRDGEVRLPERLHYSAMAADLIARLRLALTAWATEWADRTDGWSTVHIDDVSRQDAIAVLDERISDIEHATATTAPSAPGRHSRRARRST